MSHDDTEFHCTNDIDENWSTVNEQLALLEALYRRLNQRRRGLFYDETYGENVGDFLSASISEARQVALVTTECRREEAVNEVAVEIGPDGSIDVRVDSDFGEFSFTLTQEDVEADGT